MDTILNLLQKLLLFEKEPQRIGLSQFKNTPTEKKAEPSIKNKNVKLSDLMRKNTDITEVSTTETIM